MYEMLAQINTKLWLGHFDMTVEAGLYTPCFRYTGLYRGMNEGMAGQIVDDLIQLAVTECDRTRHAFAMLADPTLALQDNAMLQLALAAPAGRG